MRERELTIEVCICEEVFITGVWGNITMHELEAIEKEINITYSPSNDWDDWCDVMLKVNYEDGGRYDPSYWLVKELGCKPAGPSVSSKMQDYLLQFDKEQ